MLPQEPAMLVSYLNLKLRDCYDSLAKLCDEEDISEDELSEKLRAAGYRYDEDTNQIR
ncbi:MAG: DUF4250 domain-containing protein [Lachnospiraceae bacterium]|nr:DUF4250 domain-containing protein [Lachnospiraceae bacterium]